MFSKADFIATTARLRRCWLGRNLRTACRKISLMSRLSVWVLLKMSMRSKSLGSNARLPCFKSLRAKRFFDFMEQSLPFYNVPQKRRGFLCAHGRVGQAHIDLRLAIPFEN